MLEGPTLDIMRYKKKNCRRLKFATEVYVSKWNEQAVTILLVDRPPELRKILWATYTLPLSLLAAVPCVDSSPKGTRH